MRTGVKLSSMVNVVAFKKAVLYVEGYQSLSLMEGLEFVCLLAACVLGYSLGTFTHGVLCKFSWQQKPDSSLDLP